MATFYNQATLSFGGNTINSNITEGERGTALVLEKTAVTGSYGAGDGITYVVTLTNNGARSYDGITVTDNLGTYTIPATTTEVTPLTYVDGSVLYYVNGVLQPAPAVETDGALVISGIAVPAGGNAMLIYEARANEFAPLAQGSEIVNTVVAGGSDCLGELYDSATVPVEEEPQLTIAKAICPAVVTDDCEVIYTIILQNLGNTAVVATDNVVVSDVFEPALSDISVMLDGELLTEGAQYVYNEQTGEFSTSEGVITIPAATYVQNPETGAITTTPGVAILTVSGRI